MVLVPLHRMSQKYSLRGIAYKCAKNYTLESFNTLCSAWKDEGDKPINERGDTPLHLLAVFGNEEALNKLDALGLLTRTQVLQRNAKGDTPIHEAARFGHTKVAQKMLMFGSDLAEIQNIEEETPLYLAAAFGKKETFDFLRGNANIMTRRKDLKTVLHAAVIGEYYGLAIYILHLECSLAHMPDKNGETALNLLAKAPTSFKNGSIYTLRNAGKTPFIPLQILAGIIYSCIPALYVDDDKSDVGRVTRWSFTQNILDCPWFKEIDDAKQKHILALALAKRLIKLEQDESHRYPTTWNDVTSITLEANIKNKVQDPLIQATKNRIDELVMEILKTYPDAAFVYDENGKNLLHIAVESRYMFLYDYLRKVLLKARWMTEVDDEGNTIMHCASSVGHLTYFPLGPISQMSLDVFWFKADTFPHLVHVKNKAGKTAEELFEENHSKLQEIAETDAKGMCQGIMVVAAIIGAINVAALFTIPGGFDNTDGHPILLDSRKTELRWFLSYVLNTLLSSLLSLGALLSIQLSRYHTSDFYIALPLKFIIAVTSLYYATSFSLTTCVQAIILEDTLSYGYLPLIYFGVSMTGLTFIDTTCLVFGYMINVIYYSLRYTSQGVTDHEDTLTNRLLSLRIPYM